MAVLQACQASLLKEHFEGKEVNAVDDQELRRALDLSLHATEETARSIWRSMAAMVATEQHL